MIPPSEVVGDGVLWGNIVVLDFEQPLNLERKKSLGNWKMMVVILHFLVLIFFLYCCQMSFIVIIVSYVLNEILKVWHFFVLIEEWLSSRCPFLGVLWSSLNSFFFPLYCKCFFSFPSTLTMSLLGQLLGTFQGG